MADPHVRQVDVVEDMDGRPLWVGVDYDTVTIGLPPYEVWKLTSSQAEQFAQVFVRACWEAARCGTEEEMSGGD